MGNVADAGLVSILFTDLVGSTELAADVGDVVADELRRSHFVDLRAALDATGGTEVKTIGDAIMVSYRGAADALAGAVAMQRAVERRNRQLDGRPLTMRVGVSAGDATFEDGDWFGTPVVEAARLCAEADGNQILVSDLVRALAGTRSEYTVTPLGVRTLKGLPEPLAVCDVEWEVPREITTCLAARLSSTSLRPSRSPAAARPSKPCSPRGRRRRRAPVAPCSSRASRASARPGS